MKSQNIKHNKHNKRESHLEQAIKISPISPGATVKRPKEVHDRIS